MQLATFCLHTLHNFSHHLAGYSAKPFSSIRSPILRHPLPIPSNLTNMCMWRHSQVVIGSLCCQSNKSVASASSLNASHCSVYIRQSVCYQPSSTVAGGVIGPHTPGLRQRDACGLSSTLLDKLQSVLNAVAHLIFLLSYCHYGDTKT